MDAQHSDADDTFFIQNLQSVADYVKTGQVSVLNSLVPWTLQQTLTYSRTEYLDETCIKSLKSQKFINSSTALNVS